VQLRDPVNSRRLRQAVEAELHVGLLRILLSESSITDARTAWTLVLWRSIQYSWLRAPKYLFENPRGGREKTIGIPSGTDRQLCVLLVSTHIKFSNSPPQLKKVIPAWSVSCRRLTPGPGYLEALCSDNVHQFIRVSFSCG
jgi:hypothetical protein